MWGPQIPHISFLLSPEVWRCLVLTGTLSDMRHVQQNRERFPQRALAGPLKPSSTITGRPLFVTPGQHPLPQFLFPQMLQSLARQT